MAGPRSPGGRARLAVERLAGEYPGTPRDLCELTFDTPFQLLVATVLSAQTTDVKVNEVTPALFARYPTAADLAGADAGELEVLIHPTGFFRAKTRSLIALGDALVTRYSGQVPADLSDLVTLAGVGRKTGNVVRSVAFEEPGFPVDTHVTRLSLLLGLTEQTQPERIEAEVCALVARQDWGLLSLRLILHGRRVCVARRPRCHDCVLADFCPSVQSPRPPPTATRRGNQPPGEGTSRPVSAAARR